jgi:ribosomal protein S18 acetylase RimI-like enzyme
MPRRLTDKSEIRRLLNTDRQWSLYALADLDDGMFEHCDWWGHANSLALVFRALEIRPIFVLGDSTADLLRSLSEPSGDLNLKPEQFEAARGIYEYRYRRQMRRMFLETPSLRAGETERLNAGNCPEIEQLYATGVGVADAYAPFQVRSGFFRGIRRDGELVAVAGVHVASIHEGVAALGNIFVRADCRGQGLAQTVTSAVVTGLQEAGIRTIGLNVEGTNAPAIRVYERIGFRTHFDYYEGPADRCTL